MSSMWRVYYRLASGSKQDLRTRASCLDRGMWLIIRIYILEVIVVAPALARTWKRFWGRWMLASALLVLHSKIWAAVSSTPLFCFYVLGSWCAAWRAGLQAGWIGRRWGCRKQRSSSSSTLTPGSWSFKPPCFGYRLHNSTKYLSDFSAFRWGGLIASSQPTILRLVRSYFGSLWCTFRHWRPLCFLSWLSSPAALVALWGWAAAAGWRSLAPSLWSPARSRQFPLSFGSRLGPAELRGACTAQLSRIGCAPTPKPSPWGPSPRSFGQACRATWVSF